MHAKSNAIVAAARACIGTRFRAQGRLPGVGLDCIGVALIAARAAGLTPVRLPAYTLGGDDHDWLMAVFDAAGCTRLAAAGAAPGDLLVVAPATGRRHLAVVTPHGLVHAHAGLGRVVEAPADPAWEILAAWRLPEVD